MLKNYTALLLHRLHAVRQAGIGDQALVDRSIINIEQMGGRYRCGGILEIVRSLERRP